MEDLVTKRGKNILFTIFFERKWFKLGGWTDEGLFFLLVYIFVVLFSFSRLYRFYITYVWCVRILFFVNKIYINKNKVLGFIIQ